LYVSAAVFLRNVYDYFTTIPSGGGCLTITRRTAAAAATRYYIGVYNPNAIGQTIRLLAFVIRAPGVDNSRKFSSAEETRLMTVSRMHRSSI
jgi:hypothetical protein